ncbi:hypothetical protein HK105_208689 [Polyrhizophydium stewartii]|uniref:Uncharacterized protein n=1 Tax=Polyrhizophydium stewartii TaxID=2732419 RepID=A0ABR4MX98_9FUNG
MGKKGGGKRKGKKKNAGDLPGQKFEPMPLTWPGKVSDENLFSSMAREVRAELEAQQQDRHVCLRVRQLDWDFHDFFITLPKSATIYRLQHEIAKAQHLLSVSPEDVIIYRKSPYEAFAEQRAAAAAAATAATAAGVHATAGSSGTATSGGAQSAPLASHAPSGQASHGAGAAAHAAATPAWQATQHDAGHAANPASSRERKAESLEDALADEAGGAMMHASRFEALNITCDDPRSTLSSCFAEVAKFVLDTRAKPESPEPHGSDDADEPAPSAAGGDNTGTQAAPADKPARARSAGKSRAHSAGRSSRGKRSRPASAASSKSSKAPPEEPAGPVCGALSVKFMHDILPPRRPRSANLSKGALGPPLFGGTLPALGPESKLKSMVAGPHDPKGTAGMPKAARREAFVDTQARGKQTGSSSSQQHQPQQTHQQSQPSLQSKPAVALGGGPEPEIPDAVTIYYDIRPYISKSIGKPAEEVRTIEAELESHIANLRTTFEKAALTRRQSQVPGGYLDMDSHVSGLSGPHSLSRGGRGSIVRNSTTGRVPPSHGSRLPPPQEKQEQQHEAPKQHHFDIDCALLMREEKEWVHRTHVSSAGTAEASIMAAAAAAASSKKRFNGFAGTVKTLMRVKALSKTLHGQGHRGGRLGALAREEPVRHDISEGLSAVMQQISASLRAT